MPNIRKPKTVGEMQKQIAKIAAKTKDPKRLLRALKSVPAPLEEGPPLALRFGTIERAPLLRALGKSSYADAAPGIFDYTKRTRLNSERIAGIEALGNLGYKKAIPFIRTELEQAERMNAVMQYHPSRAEAKEIWIKKFRAAKEALKKLEAK